MMIHVLTDVSPDDYLCLFWIWYTFVFVLAFLMITSMKIEIDMLSKLDVEEESRKFMHE